MLKIGLVVVAGLVALVGFMAIVGALLPVAHRASRSAELTAPPERVFGIVVDVANAASWRPELKRVEILEPTAGKLRFREVDSRGEGVLFEIEESTAPSRLVTRIADEKLPFGGKWVIEISPAPKGSRVTVTELGEVYNPLFRFLSRFVFGHTRSIDAYLSNLERTVGTGA